MTAHLASRAVLPGEGQPVGAPSLAPAGDPIHDGGDTPRMAASTPGRASVVEPRSSFDLDALARLWTAGETCQAIAEVLGCGHNRVSTLAAKMGLPKRGPGWRGPGYGARAKGQDAPPVAADPAPLPADLRSAVLATGGRYARLEELRQREGLTPAQVLGLWHRERAA